ncbi:Glutamyl-tRNA(Gln) amidotransferase subunit F, mitochondrial-like protein [Elsinoe fawcettii]|nr:Glutamyl-tRNA(Gln) amidotransferase subunit F, mitochondrial-like protein [Elsinoe fawcettii]
MSLLSPLARAARAQRWHAHHHIRIFSSTSLCRNNQQPASIPIDKDTTTSSAVDIDALLSTPSWDPATLLPPPGTGIPLELTTAKLHHLLRLSALPPPKDKAEEDSLLLTLAQQLHFVKQIQNVDTTGVEPLTAIRDETETGKQAGELTVQMVQDVLSKEEVKGRYAPRRRRRKTEEQASKKDWEWDVLGNASRKVGRYFVVEKTKA